ncbi:MAG: hypothetical protein RIM99_18960 [Cyclobacteriaceae bacterium]
MMSNPKKLFIIDGLGAILSAFLLGVVLVKYESVFGIPSQTLYLLATMPVFFAIYDLYSYIRGNEHADRHLRIIAIVNLLYCCLSIGFAFYHFDTITILGWSYILAEIVIVVVLAIVELKTAKN